MRDNEQKAGSVADQKNKIRERYKGVSIDELDVIPALPQEDIFAVENEQRVAMQGYPRTIQDKPLLMSYRKTITTMSSAKVRTGSSYRFTQTKASQALPYSTVTSLN